MARIHRGNLDSGPRVSIGWLTAIVAVLVSGAVSAGSALAGVAPENVAIVVNGDSEVSQTIAQEYARLRNIPANNIVVVREFPHLEKISIEDFRQHILGPVFQTLTERDLLPQIDVIAYSAEIPTAIDVKGDLGERRLPRVLTPVASINGLTFLHQAVMAKDVRYLDLNANWYARRVGVPSRDTPWTPEEQQRYAAILEKMRPPAPPVQQEQPRENSQSENGEPAQKDAAANKNATDKNTTDKNNDPAAATERLQAVVAGLDELLQTHPHAVQLHYNRACGLALLGQPNNAILALQDAVRSGWWDHQHTLRDEDLKSLRDRDDFKSLVADMREVEFESQPALGFKSAHGWLPDGRPTADPRAPRYMLSAVLACTTGRGNSVDEALDQLRRTVAADGSRPTGTIYFLRNGDVRSKTREWAFQNAARMLADRGVQAVVVDGVLPNQKDDVAGAVIGTASFDWAKSGSTILPGAIVEHLTSFGGVMTKGAGQTPLTEWLKHGAAGSSGTVTEPFAIQAKFPTPFLQVHYASGCTLVESFYLSVTGPYQLLIVGDPLAQPWRKEFTVHAPALKTEAPLTGLVEIRPQTEATNNLAADAWELYVNGRRILSVPANAALAWDTRQHPDGAHTITIIARGNDDARSLARSTYNVVVRNMTAE